MAVLLGAATLAYIAAKIVESPEQALQFTLNGVSVGAVYALLAMGFTLVYSTVWFFDLYYGAAAALGAYGVFYLNSDVVLGGRYEVNNPLINIALAVVVAGVVGWALRTRYRTRLRWLCSVRTTEWIIGAAAAVVGACAAIMLIWPTRLHTMAAPAVGAAVALLAFGVVRAGSRALSSPKAEAPPTVAATAAATGRARFGATRGSVAAWIAAIAAGGLTAAAVAGSPGWRLYLSWGLSCLLAGVISVALYRGLYVRMLARARSSLIMLVASLGVLLALTAATSIVFEAAPRPLPEAFGSDSWHIAGASIKAFNVFAIVMAVAGFAVLWLLLRRTSFGKMVRAVGDDEEVSKVVGINTTAVIAAVFFIGACYAAFAGILSGHDTAILPRMGLLLLLKGWIASVVGGIGNLHGAIVGGFVLGLIEQFGIWDLAGEWRDAVSFGVLILFLSLWPQGLLPRR